MDNKELTPIQKLMLSIETTPEICFPIEINFNDGQEILEALQSQNTYNPETHVVIPKEPDRDKARLMGEFKLDINECCHTCDPCEPDEDCDECGGGFDYTRSEYIPWTTIKDIRKAITSKGE